MAMAELKKMLNYDRNSEEFPHQHAIHKSFFTSFLSFFIIIFYTNSKLYFMLDINWNVESFE